jgi:hypothetical protein
MIPGSESRGATGLGPQCPRGHIAALRANGYSRAKKSPTTGAKALIDTLWPWPASST